MRKPANNKGPRMRQERRTIKFENGRERCPDCHGLISYSSAMRDKLPIGFGFVGARFQIDAVARHGFGGECMDCLAPVFAVKTRRHIVRYLKLNADQARKVGGRK